MIMYIHVYQDSFVMGLTDCLPSLSLPHPHCPSLTTGHVAKDCPSPPKPKSCHICGETGHLKADCPKA